MALGNIKGNEVATRLHSLLQRRCGCVVMQNGDNAYLAHSLKRVAAVDPREPFSGMLRDRGLRRRRVVRERVCRSVIKRGVPGGGVAD